jgi:hypothetical protein
MSLPSLSHAEALDDASIRALYAEDNAFADDNKKEAAFLSKRLDDGFVATAHIMQRENGATPKSIVETDTKAELIEQTASDELHYETKKSSYNISSIQYSKDHTYAVVTYSVTEKGIITTGNNSANYESAEACVEKVELVGNLLRKMQAECNVNIALSDR